MSYTPRDRSEPLLGSRAIKLAAVAIVLAALYFGKPMLAPLALAILLSMLLTPPVHFLERYIGRVSAVIVSAVLSIFILSSAGYGVGVKVVELAGHMPEFKERIRRKAESLKNSTGNKWVSKTIDSITEFSQELGAQNPLEPAITLNPSTTPIRVENVSQINAVELTTSILGPLLAPLETAVIVLIFSIYILIQPDDLRNRLVRLAGRKQIRATSHAIDEVSKRVSHYLLMQSVINLVYGALIAAGMMALGFSDGLVWGGLVAILRFVPYLGTWIAALPPFLLLLATTDGWQPVHLLLLFAALDLVFAFVAEPLIIGGGTGISPLSLLVAAVFWAWLWGPIGLLLSTPLTVCLAVMGKHVGALRFLNVLLTDKPVLTAHVRFYHRLLAGNRSMALDLLASELKDKSHCQICDAMLLPALVLSQVDLRFARIDDQRARAVREFAVELLTHAALSNDLPAMKSKIDPALLKTLPEFAVLCFPARTEADETAGRVFASLLRAYGIPAHDVSINCAGADILKLIEERNPEIVCISAVPPGAAPHARKLYRAIRERFPHVEVVFGLWGLRSETKGLRSRLECSASDKIVVSYSAAFEFVEAHIPAMLQKNQSTASV